MKKITLALAISASIASNWANAGYNCQTPDAKTTLTTSFRGPNRLGTDTQIVLKSGLHAKYFWGSTTSNNGTLMQKEIVQIYPYNAGNTLTIVNFPSHCGRGFCDPKENQSITANFKVGKSELNFNCYETAN